MIIRSAPALIAVAALTAFALTTFAQPPKEWGIHDMNRPQPKVIEPGTASTPDQPGKPPSDATVLFDGKDLSRWRADKDGGPAGWKVENGYMEVVKGTGGIHTEQGFGDVQLHIEWRTPAPPHGEGQERGNSGVFLLGKFEVQVLDSFQNPTYPDGQAAALYGQFPPLVNASRRPGEWQTYDIVFTAPRFRDGKLDAPAVATVFHNGIVVHHATPFWGPTAHRQILPYSADLTKGPIALQDHSNPVRFRNIWIRPANVRES